MNSPWTIADVIASTPTRQPNLYLPAPEYDYRPISRGQKVALAVPSMKNHTTDEGWQLMLGLKQGGYWLEGYRADPGIESLTNVVQILDCFETSTLIIQDKREWIGKTAGSEGFDERERFTNVDYLAKRPDVFKLTILKDAHIDHQLHVEAAEEIGCHAWIVYYDPKIVKHLAPYVRERHLVRTYHSVDKTVVPEFIPRKERRGGILSGAISGAYPLRLKIRQHADSLPGLNVFHHPGYGRTGCKTIEYMNELSKYKVAICTASRYGYTLRKIVEASACGCRVVTDLSADEVLPGIDENLIRVRPDVSIPDLGEVLNQAYETYDDEKQHKIAEVAKYFYDYRRQGQQLAVDIETLRRNYK